MKYLVGIVKSVGRTAQDQAGIKAEAQFLEALLHYSAQVDTLADALNSATVRFFMSGRASHIDWFQYMYIIKCTIVARKVKQGRQCVQYICRQANCTVFNILLNVIGLWRMLKEFQLTAEGAAMMNAPLEDVSEAEQLAFKTKFNAELEDAQTLFKTTDDEHINFVSTYCTNYLESKNNHKEVNLPKCRELAAHELVIFIEKNTSKRKSSSYGGSSGSSEKEIVESYKRKTTASSEDKVGAQKRRTVIRDDDEKEADNTEKDTNTPVAAAVAPSSPASSTNSRKRAASTSVGRSSERPDSPVSKKLAVSSTAAAMQKTEDEKKAKAAADKKAEDERQEKREIQQRKDDKEARAIRRLSNDILKDDPLSPGPVEKEKNEESDAGLISPIAVNKSNNIFTSSQSQLLSLKTNELLLLLMLPHVMLLWTSLRPLFLAQLRPPHCPLQCWSSKLFMETCCSTTPQDQWSNLLSLVWIPFVVAVLGRRHVNWRLLEIVLPLEDLKRCVFDARYIVKGHGPFIEMNDDHSIRCC